MVNFNWYWMFLLILSIVWQPSGTIAPDRWNHAVLITPYDTTIRHKKARKYLTGGERNEFKKTLYER
jgi:PhoPQ-activated pathogenicity-related protein